MARKDYYHEPNAPEPNSLVSAVSAVVTDSEGRILLHKRSDNFLWSTPGGAMELGESVEQAVIREVKEETGFDVEVLRCIGIYSDPGHVIALPTGRCASSFLSALPAGSRWRTVGQLRVGSGPVFYKGRIRAVGPASRSTYSN